MIKIGTTRAYQQSGILSPRMENLIVDKLLRKLSDANINCHEKFDLAIQELCTGCITWWDLLIMTNQLRCVDITKRPCRIFVQKALLD